MKRVVVNLVGLDPAANGGVSRIAREVCRLHVAAEARGELRAVYAVGERFVPVFGGWLGQPGAAVVAVDPALGALPADAPELYGDLVVSPLFGSVPFDRDERFAGVPGVAAMPDALALDLPELFSADDLCDRQRIYSALRSQRRVVTLTEHARGRLTALLDIDPERVVIVPAGVELVAADGVTAAVPEPFVLYPANDWPHKRHDLLVAAMVEAWRKRPELALVLTGSHRPGFAAELARTHGAPPERVLDLGFVSDERLAALYAAAEAVVFASRYEGYGMPIVEAMSAGCPVVCAPLTAIPEVGGDAALYVDSDTPQAWARALTDELPAVRATLVERGRRLAAGRGWGPVSEGWRTVLEPLWAG